MKASEKQELTKKLVTRLEKQFGRTPEASDDRTVLDTLLYAVCLENEDFASADRADTALHEQFHDLNEIRVSSITELASVFQHQSDPELRAHRIRSILQFVFEDQFEFDLEAIRKKTQEQAAKKLGKIRDLSPFVRNYVQQVTLGAHLVPLDDRMTAAAVWLGLVEPGISTEAAAEALKPAVRKADAPTFCYVLRRFTSEPPGRNIFDPTAFQASKEEFSASDALKRVEDLLSGKTRNTTKTKPPQTTRTEKKTSSSKAAAKRTPAKKSKTATDKSSAAEKKTKGGRSRAAS